MTVNQTYHTWFAWLKQLWPEQHLPVVRNAAWFVAGLHDSHSVQLQSIARKIPSQAKLLSRGKRLTRLLQEAGWPVRPCYAPVARALLQDLAHTVGEIPLIADGSRVAFHHQILLVCVASRRRAVPVAWTWIPSARGHSSAWRQLALLAYVHRLLPTQIPFRLSGIRNLRLRMCRSRRRRGAGPLSCVKSRTIKCGGMPRSRGRISGTSSSIQESASGGQRPA